MVTIYGSMVICGTQKNRLHRVAQPVLLKLLTMSASELPPDHLVDHADVALDDADDLGGDVLVNVVGDGDAREAVADERYGHINALQEPLGVDAAEHEAALV